MYRLVWVFCFVNNFLSLAVQLTASEVLKEVEGVTEWFYIAQCLGISLADSVQESKESTQGMDACVIHKWLEMGKECTWQRLVDVLVSAMQYEIAGRIATKYGNKLYASCAKCFIDCVKSL